MFTPFSFFSPPNGGGGDADADAYIAEVIAQGGTLSGAEETAIDTFYTNLKSAGIYNKLHVFYPFLGGTATSNAVEGINPGGTYDLTFNGSWTHSITGSSTPQAVGNYANTSFNPSASADLFNSFSFGVYTLAPGGGTSNGFMGFAGFSGGGVLFGPSNSRTAYQWRNANITQTLATGTGDWNAGQHFFQSRIASNNIFGGYADSSTGDTITTGSVQTQAYTNPPNLTLWFSGNNGGTISNIGGEMRFGWVGEGFNYSELQTLSTNINNLQTAFSRNVYS